MEMLKFSTKPLRTPHFQNHFWVSQNSRIHGVYNSKGGIFSYTLTCNLKTSKGKKFSKRKIVPGRIYLPDSVNAPPLVERKVEEEGTRRNNADGEVVFKKVPKRALGVFSDSSLATGEMFAVAGLMALGTIVDQPEVPDSYFQKFDLDRMFSSPIFLGTLALLIASLMVRTHTTQVPLEKVARRRSFLNAAEATRNQEHADQQYYRKQEHAQHQTCKPEHADTLSRASVKDLGVTLMGAGYEVSRKGPARNAFKGLAGRIARIGVHLALLLVMSGGNLSAAGSFRGNVNVPQGLDFVVGDVLALPGFQSTPSDPFSTEAHVDQFNVDYNESGENEEGPYSLAMVPLNLNGDKKLFVTFLPVGDDDSSNVKGISMLAGDLQSIILYNKEWKFACVRWLKPHVPIEIDQTTTIIVDTIGCSGLDLKTYPEVQIVSAGFGFLMLNNLH